MTREYSHKRELVSNIPDDPISEEMPIIGLPDEELEEISYGESQEQNPYTKIIFDIYKFTQEADIPVHENYITEARRDWEQNFENIRGQEALLEQGLASEKEFVAILDSLSDLAANNFSHDEPIGQEAAIFAGRLIEKHLPQLDALIREGVDRDESEDHSDIGASIRALHGLIQAGDRYFKHEELNNFCDTALRALGNNIEHIEKAIYSDLKSKPLDYESKLNNYIYALEPLFQFHYGQYKEETVRHCVARITADIITHQQKIFFGHINTGAKEMADIIIKRLSYQSYRALNEKIPAEFFLQKILQGYGLSPDKVHHEWQRSIYLRSPGDFHRIVKRNLEAMGNIEWSDRAKRSSDTNGGAVKYLNEHFGIYDFARYPERMMVEQYEADQAGETNRPYGIIINARDDWNGALYYDSSKYHHLFRQLERQEKSWLIRVIEVDNKREMGRRAMQFIKTYGPAKFGIIGGHGSENCIHLGKREGMFMLSVDDVKGPGIQRGAKMLFEEHAPIALISCSTGAKEGIGQKISDTFGFTVTGPTIPTSLRSLDIEINEKGTARLSVEYNEKGIAKTYGEKEK